jgi:glycosyltransferase involved in cell wall biosynthesis
MPTAKFPTAASADVALLLEGTYPFVRGGVSAWVHHLIQGFPEIRFAAVFLGSEPGAYKGIRYELPPNLVHLEAHYLYDRSRAKPREETQVDPHAFADMRAMHEGFAAPGGCPAHLLAANADHLLAGRLGEGQFQGSREAWDMITAYYRDRTPDASFLDYFWTIRSMHDPVWSLARIARALIPARCYHSVSTGYAGFLGALLSQAHKRPFVLTEHGLYTKERKIDLLQSAWIEGGGGTTSGGTSGGGALGAEGPEGSYIRRLWIRFFEALGKSAYAAADPVISLYEGIRQQQIQDGAAADRSISIPNGIRLERFQALRSRQEIPPRPIFTLIGRVVPIKDIKTFLRAMRSVRARLPGAEGWIVGPGDEDPAYFAECQALSEALGLSDTVRFLGFRDVDEVLPRTAVLVLSSISEALPLTLLEGFAAGVPAVSTDVGSCRQLIQGRQDDAEDKAIGAAGRVVGIGDPSALAEAIAGLYRNQEEWSSARTAAMARVERYYTERRMLDRYAEIYGKALA